VQQGVAIKSLSKLHKGSKSHKNAETHYTGLLRIMKYVRFYNQNLYFFFYVLNHFKYIL